VHNGRERLSIGDKVPSPEAEETVEDQDDPAGFFDQDE
jgi:hypothetical protein